MPRSAQSLRSMNRRLFSRLGLALVCTALLGGPVMAYEDVGHSNPADQDLKNIIVGPQRTSANRDRDASRNPYEVLHFFGLNKNMTVVEIWPGAGYWTEILAPYLHEHGTYYAALGESSKMMDAKLATDPELYGQVKLTRFDGDKYAIAPDGTADLVVTFRNLHNWMDDGTAQAAFRAFFKALKPGGVLGIEDHRGRTDQPQDERAGTGYVRQDYAIALAEKAGFLYAGSSEVNANPKDTKDYPEGVWTLPPTFKLGDVDRAKYAAIGESDRFVLKFTKPLN
jgi:predicted methyltransferase